MKYVVNQRGGAKQISDQLFASLINSGYIEITKKQFEDKKYYPEYDRGTDYKDTPTFTTPVQTQPIQEATSKKTFKTRIV